MRLVGAGVWPALSALCVAASPYHLLEDYDKILEKRDNNDDNNSKFPLWIPIVILAAVSVVLVFYSWTKRAVQSSTPPVTQNRPATGITPEVRTSRPRRNRRTASQRSTRSLPAYMEEPGDEELVLVARQRETPDTLEEEDEDSPRNTAETERPYLSGHPGVASSVDISAPLMHADYSHEAQSSRHTRHPSSHSQNDGYEGHGRNLSSTSFNHASEQDLSSADIVDSTIVGATPPGYFEVVGEGVGVQQGNVTTHSLDSPSHSLARTQTNQTTDTSTTSHSRTTSTFSLRGLFGRRPSTSESPAGSVRHPESPTSTIHTQMTDASSSSPSVILPRPSSSFSNLNPLHRISSHSPAPSPTPSRNISAPLSHTVVRTEFTFPKSGPTPQQVSFLASRDSLARFGVPFGADAEAASEEVRRQRLMDEQNPPPAFESPTVERSASSITGDRDEGGTIGSHQRSSSSSRNTLSIQPEASENLSHTSPMLNGNSSDPSLVSTSIQDVQSATASSAASSSRTPAISVSIPQRPTSKSISSLRTNHLSPIAGSPVASVANGHAS